MSVRINTGVSKSGGEWSCQRTFAKFYSALRRLLFTALPSPGMIILCKVVRDSGILRALKLREVSLTALVRRRVRGLICDL